MGKLTSVKKLLQNFNAITHSLEVIMWSDHTTGKCTKIVKTQKNSPVLQNNTISVQYREWTILATFLDINFQ